MNESETRGVAILAMAISQATLSLLKSKNIISDSEIDHLLETILTGIEELLPADDEGAQKARKLAEAIVHSFLSRRQKPSTETR